MTLDVYRGRKTIQQQQQQPSSTWNRALVYKSRSIFFILMKYELWRVNCELWVWSHNRSLFETHHISLDPDFIVPYKFYVLGQIGLSKQCRPRSDCFWRSSLIRVYAVCHSISILWMHYCNVTSNFSIFRTIMAIVWGVPNFRIFTVVKLNVLRKKAFKNETMRFQDTYCLPENYRRSI